MENRNPYLCLAIVVSLATIGTVSALGIAVIEYSGKPAPQSLAMLASATVGAIAGALAVAPHLRKKEKKSGQAANARNAEMPPRP